MSALLHDHVKEGDVIEASYPYGDFVLSDAITPVVLISAGVGLTPLLSMLNTLSSPSTSGRNVTWIQGSRSSVEQAFGSHVRKIAEHSHGRVKARFFHSKPGNEERQGMDFDFQGYVDLLKIPKEELFLEDKGADYYICGPAKVGSCCLLSCAHADSLFALLWCSS